MQLTLRPPGAALEAFAGAVGATGPVSVEGGRTQWTVGGTVDPAARLVRAPAGIVELEPAELVVRCGAGTTIAELDEALAVHGLMCPVDALRADEATVGGLLSVGHSGIRRLRYGHLRDLLLEARYVAADGVLVKAGAPVVKNVTGFDLCRLLVGSLGTVGLIGEVVLRCRPKPAVAQWWCSPDADPFAVRRLLFAPSSILWDGSSTWLLLEGDAGEVAAHRAQLTGPWDECAAPAIPDGRVSMRPRDIATLSTSGATSWLAEVGVGTVHGLGELRRSARPADANVLALQRDLKRAYDPSGRLNPGRQPW